MTDERNLTNSEPENKETPVERAEAPTRNNLSAPAPHNGGAEDFGDADDQMGDRLERLGGEPAPMITPEEFARLQKAGQVHIDARGRVRTASRSGPNAGVSLRKRRAWYAR